MASMKGLGVVQLVKFVRRWAPAAIPSSSFASAASARTPISTARFRRSRCAATSSASPAGCRLPGRPTPTRAKSGTSNSAPALRSPFSMGAAPGPRALPDQPGVDRREPRARRRQGRARDTRRVCLQRRRPMRLPSYLQARLIGAIRLRSPSRLPVPRLGVPRASPSGRSPRSSRPGR